MIGASQLRKCRVAHTLALATFVWASCASRAPAQEGPCDPRLLQPKDDPQGYRLRGDRCEGIYIREVAGSSDLVVVSLTESFEDFDPTSYKNVMVEWQRFGSDAPRIRAQGLKYRLHYRMDTVRPPGSISYAWSPDLLAALKIKRQDIGIVGFTPQVVGNVPREVYLPLRVSQQTKGVRAPRYQVVLLPGEELSQVFLTLAQVGKDGSPATFLRKGEALGGSYYPADRPISVILPELNAPGIYYLEFGATLKQGGSSTESIWFYHAGQ